jgi:hypothetical protein
MDVTRPTSWNWAISMQAARPAPSSAGSISRSRAGRRRGSTQAVKKPNGM